MLHLITGEPGSGKTTLISRQISACLEKEDGLFLVVPEQQTVVTEQEMAVLLPPDAPLHFEVTNFSRLANTVFRSLGGLSYRYANGTNKALLMYRTLCDLLPHLKSLHSQTIDQAQVSNTLAAVRELKTEQLTPGALEAAAKNMPDGPLTDKLHDLALTAAAYGLLLEESFRDADNDLDLLAGQLDEVRFFEGKKLWFDGFTDFTRQQYRVLSRLMEQADVTVTLPLPCPPACDALTFAAIAACRRTLLDLASRAGVQVQEVNLGEWKRNRTCDLSRLLHVLPDSRMPQRGDQASSPDGSVVLVECKGTVETAEYIAADILRRVREGALFRDFAIIGSEIDLYAGILDRILEEADIPYFLSRRTDLSAFEPVRLTSSAYAILTDGYRIRDVFTFLKCGIPGIAQEDIDLFELYCERWNLSGRRLADDLPLTMNPDGYRAVLTDRGTRVLAVVNRTKDRLNQLLAPLAKSAESALTVPEHCRILADFLVKTGTPAFLTRRSTELLQRRDRTAAADYEQLWPALCDTLDRIAETLPDLTVTAAAFSTLFSLALSGADIGRIPSSLDEVLLGSADLVRSEGRKWIYLIGLSEREFPAPPRQGGLFSPAERRQLAALSLPLGDAPDESAARPLFSFYRSLAGASRGVILLYSRIGPDQSTQTPSRPFRYAQALLGITPILADELQPDVLLTSRACVLSRLGALPEQTRLSLDRLFRGDPVYTARRRSVAQPVVNDRLCLEPETASRLYAGDLALTQSRMDLFRKCPFQYFCRYVLKLEEGEPASFNAANIGTFVHAVLERFFDQLQQQEQDIASLSDEESERLVADAARWYIASAYPDLNMRTPRVAHLMRLLTRSAGLLVRDLRDEFSHSLFRPCCFELHIDRSDPALPQPVAYPLPDGNNLYVYGVVDRLDVYRKGTRTYLRVVDYKTGRKDFNTEHLERGQDLQLFLYMDAILHARNPLFRRRLGISEEDELLPAGILYLHAGTGEISLASPLPPERVQQLARKELKRSGILLNDPAILTAMDDTEDSQYLPITRNKDGSVSKTAEKRLFHLEEWGDLSSRITKAISQIGAELKKGAIPACPQPKDAQPCAYCAMKPFCRAVRS